MRCLMPFLIVHFTMYSMGASDIALNIADTIDHREHVYIGNFVINTWFKDDINPHLIVPHLKERLNELWNSDNVDDQGSLMDLRKMVHKIAVTEEQKARVLHTIIIPAAKEAIKKQHKKATRRLTKRQSAWIAAGTGLATTIISSGVAIAISSSTHNCP